MNQEKKIANPMFKLDDFFKTEEQRNEEKKEKIEKVNLELLDEFPNHPFKVLENDDFYKLVDSIEKNKMLEPILVRPKNDGRFEIISGHRRKKANEILGNKEIDCIVRDMTDEEATIFMVDSNLHREQILPSEKAFAYKMKFDALKHQGIRTDLTSSPLATKFDSASIIGKENGESRDTVYRFIRLTELIPQLLEFVDNSVIGDKDNYSMALRPAVEISFLNKDEQLILLDVIEMEDATPSHAQAIRIRELSRNNKFDINSVSKIMQEEKANQIANVKVNEAKLRNVLPKNMKIDNMEDFIIKAVKHYSKFLREKDMER